MFIGRVMGSVWSTVKWPQAEGLKLLLVRPSTLEDLRQSASKCSEATLSASTLEGMLESSNGDQLNCPDLVVAADSIGAGVGEWVIVAYGHAGRMAVEPDLGPDALPTKPVDAGIVAIIDGFDLDPC